MQVFKAIFLILIISLLTSCQIRKELPLNLTTINSASCIKPVSKLTVSAPPKNTNAFKFQDIISSDGYSDGTVYVIDGYNRADFDYFLTSDSAPLIKEQLSDLYPETGSTPASLSIHFNYYLTDTNAFSNEITLVIISKFILGSQIPQTNQIKLSDTYSTFPLTYPSADFLNSLLLKGINKLKEVSCN